MTPAHIINTFCFILPCFILLFLTFKDHLRTPAFMHIAGAILLYLAVTFYGSRTYASYAAFPLKYVILGLSTIILGAVIFDMATEYRLGHGIFIVAIAKCYAEQVTLLSMYVYFLFHGRLPFYNTFDSSLIRAALTLATFPLIYTFFRKSLRPALDYTASFSIWNQVWIIPICNNLLYNMLFSPNISSLDSVPDKFFYYVPPLWIILTFSTYILIIKMVIVIIENANLQEKLHISETISSSQRKQTETLQLQIEQTSRQRHDMRHHLIVIDTYIRTKDIKGLNAYIKKYRASLTPPADIYCENLALNSIVGYYKERSEGKGTVFHVSISLPKEPLIPDTDLCAIVSNLLENASEACERMNGKSSFINIKISVTTSSLLAIIIENSYEGEIQKSGNIFISSKKKGRRGIGISSVLNIIEQYNGLSKFEYVNQIFKVSILLKFK
ncbi:MAG: sensor histidine kinase [Dorea sp.]|nr:sensor histidine kinase [Dorea sp.]